MLKVIKDINYIKTLVEFSLKPTNEIKVQIDHCLENLIDLDQILYGQKSTIETEIEHLCDSQSDHSDLEHHFDALNKFNKID
jgi:hypothetical protein